MTQTAKRQWSRALTDENLVLERPHLGGVQRVYRFAGGFGLSLVNSTVLHVRPFAWEAAVLGGVGKDGNFGRIIYDTPLTHDVEVFSTDGAANAFIKRARDYFAAKARGR